MILSFISILLNLIFPVTEIDQNTELIITSVKVESGGTNRYAFSVGIQSDDKGCEQYADWWEVVTPEGTLLYRRILQHSHVQEQPFIRSGGPVRIDENQIVVVRGHMNTSGYSIKAYQGSVKAGFKPKVLANDFALELEKQEPLPTGCAF